MKTTQEITLDDLRAGCHAAIAARQRGEYDQASWCGTERCIWGWTISCVGLPPLDAVGGPPISWRKAHILPTALLLSVSSSPEQMLKLLDRKDLCGADLRGADLRFLDLRGAVLRNLDLRGAVAVMAALSRRSGGAERGPLADFCDASGVNWDEI